MILNDDVTAAAFLDGLKVFKLRIAKKIANLSVWKVNSPDASF
jgi:hypothetical protein